MSKKIKDCHMLLLWHVGKAKMQQNWGQRSLVWHKCKALESRLTCGPSPLQGGFPLPVDLHVSTLHLPHPLMEDGRRAPREWKNEKWETNSFKVSFLCPHEDINVLHKAIHCFESLQLLAPWRKPCRKLPFMRLGKHVMVPPKRPRCSTSFSTALH